MSRDTRALLLGLLLVTAPPAGAQMPSFQLPAPTGRLPVGTTRFAVTTLPRRPLVVTAWYPASTSSGRLAPYLPEQSALARMAGWGRNPATRVLQHVGVLTHARLDVPVAGKGVPVLVFSHGYLDLPSEYTALMEDLASHGFAVFSIAHTGETMAVTLPGGRVDAIFTPDNRLAPVPAGVLAEWETEDSVSTAVTGAKDPAAAEATLRAFLAAIPRSTEALDRWVADTRVVVDEVVRLAAPGSGSRFAGRLDTTGVGAFGHSMGGIVSAAFCARDARCRAAINLDGSPQYGDLIDRPSPRPMLMVYAGRHGRVGVSDLVYRRGAEYWRAVMPEALHLNYGDWQYWEPPERLDQGLGDIDPAEATVMVHRLVREFFARQLFGTASPLLDGTERLPGLTVERVPGGAG